jgi:mannitol-specific phosphotransferase system IIBC component
MKNTLFLLIFCFITFLSFSQDYDKRLEKLYSVEELTALQKENPSKIITLNYAIDNAVYTSDLPLEKKSEFTKSINYDFKKKPNFIELGLKIENQSQYFRINGTNKILVIKSEYLLNYELKNIKK